MTIKMAAPLRQTVEVIKYCIYDGLKQILKPRLCRKIQLSETLLTFNSTKRAFTHLRTCAKCSVPATLTKLCNVSHELSMTSEKSYCSSSFEERKCWKCGSETNTKKELFFCNCGVVQEVPSDLDYFAALGFEEGYDVDIERLSKLYKDLQRRLHPDKYAQKSKEEIEVADRQSAYINKAYSTLLRPLSRGLYLLELHGETIDESNTSVDPEFLMLMMEFNEELSEKQHDISIVKKLQKQNTESLNKCVDSISEAFKNKDISEAKNLVIKLKYYTNIDEKIKEILRHKMDRWTM